MADPNTPGSKTTEFYLALIANAVGAVLASGLLPDSSQITKILGIVTIVLGTLGYTWSRTTLKTAKIDAAAAPAYAAVANAANVAAAAATPAANTTNVALVDARKPEAGAVDPTVLLWGAATAIVFALFAAFSACSSVKGTGQSLASSVVDCTSARLAGSVRELRPLGSALLANAVEGGKVNWGPVRDVAKGFATDVGRCVFADAITRLLAPAAPGAPKVAPLLADPAATRAGFRAIADELYGGQSFKTEAGAL